MVIFYDANITYHCLSQRQYYDKKCSSRPITIVVTAPIIIPTSIDARTKMIDLRERESTEISDTNEETNIAISIEVAAPYSMEVAAP